MLRREGFEGPVTLLSADASIPYDRPNLSKGYLAGNAPEEYIPLRSDEFYKKHRIDVKLNVRATAIDTGAKQLRLADGTVCGYGALLIATGADPVRLDVPGSSLPHVHYLRSLADSRAMIAGARNARRAVVIGASFIGLEVAAALRARDIEVDVITPESCPMERVLGTEVGQFVRQLHEQHGVRFHFGTTATKIDEHQVTLANGEELDAGLVVVGIGVRPMVALAEEAGLAIDRGVTVDQYLETSVPGVYAAGDIVRWPDALTGARIRVEHWAVAERQGQTAAKNILGRAQPFDAVPFFWTEQYDFTLSYVGHAEKWDRVEIDGKLEDRDCAITYWQGDRKLAVAVIGRDLEGLRAEVELERSMARKHG
jgi:NADPH-dependent 2,4-dienoyl-CoA reductase/sulfur reductase-like enzyme